MSNLLKKQINYENQHNVLSENTYSIAQAVGAPRVLRIAKGNSLKSIAESNSMFSKFNPSSVQT